MLCGAVGATLFQSSAKRVSVVIAARNLPAGTVLTPADLATGSLPASDNITAMSASGSGVLVGQQFAVPATRGQLMVRAMVSTTPSLSPGSQVVGVLLKGDQMPSVPIVVGDRVQVDRRVHARSDIGFQFDGRHLAGHLGHGAGHRSTVGQRDPVCGGSLP